MGGTTPHRSALGDIFGVNECRMSAMFTPHSSLWTSVYADNSAQGLVWYVRFTPGFMDLEAAGWSHGISIGNTNFATEEEATQFALMLDKFFNTMLREAASQLPDLLNELDAT